MDLTNDALAIDHDGRRSERLFPVCSGPRVQEPERVREVFLRVRQDRQVGKGPLGGCGRVRVGQRDGDDAQSRAAEVLGVFVELAQLDAAVQSPMAEEHHHRRAAALQILERERRPIGSGQIEGLQSDSHLRRAVILGRPQHSRIDPYAQRDHDTQASADHRGFGTTQPREEPQR